MKPDFKKGFTVHRNGGDFVFVTQHSGPAIETPTARDQFSDTVASLCWEKMGGTLILSNVSRKRTWGIDLNRMKPPRDLAVKYFSKFEKDTEREKLLKYRKKYAWVAVNERDHEHRAKIYDSFWKTVRNSGRLFVFLHTKLIRPKNFPVMMDLVTFEGKGVDTEITQKIVDGINKEYKNFFEDIKSLYIRQVLIEIRKTVHRIKRIFGNFSLEKAGIEYKEHLLQDLEFIKKYADKDKYNKLNEKFNLTNFVNGSKNAMRNAPCPYISLNKIHKGALAYGPRTELKMKKDNIILEIELNEFMSRFFPEEAADIINKIVDKLRKIEKYKMMGVKQTELLKFI